MTSRAHESGHLASTTLTSVSRSGWVRWVGLLGVLGACSSSPAPNDGTGAGGGGAGGTASGVAGTTGTGGGSAGTGGGSAGTGGAGCTNIQPGDTPFACPSTYAEEVAGRCVDVEACGSFRGVDNPGFQHFYAITCWYDGQGALAWAERCEDSPTWCGQVCITSTGKPSQVAGCFPAQSTCDGGTDASGGDAPGD
jgi:hypothetical protein